MVNNHRQRGISLLELLLAFVVISALLYAATRYFSVTNENLKVSQAEEMINNVVNASYQWLQGQANFKGVSIATLTTAGLLPQNYTTTTINPWHGSIAVSAWSGNANQLQITLTNLPSTSCQNLKEKLNLYISSANSGCVPADNTNTFIGVFNSQ